MIPILIVVGSMPGALAVFAEVLAVAAGVVVVAARELDPLQPDTVDAISAMTPTQIIIRASDVRTLSPRFRLVMWAILGP
jgi:hypothetical protein